MAVSAVVKGETDSPALPFLRRERKAAEWAARTVAIVLEQELQSYS